MGTGLMEGWLLGWLLRKHVARYWKTALAHIKACLKEGWLLGKYLARYWETGLAHMEAYLKEELADEQTLGKILGD